MKLVTIERGILFIRLLGALILGLSFMNPASAARFPNAVEQKLIFSGAASNKLADLFEVSAASETLLSLRLGRGDAWAVYLLKQDTKEKIYNDNDGSPPRYNLLEFSTNENPSLTISPFWLDLGTRAPSPEPGSYSFSSPFLSAKVDQKDSWLRLLHRLRKEPNWHENAETALERTFTFSEGKNLTIKVLSSHDYETNKDGHMIVITARGK